MNKKIAKRSNAVENKYDNIKDSVMMLKPRLQYTIFYPPVNVSLEQFRNEELRLTKSSARKGSSFLNLFGKRLTRMPGDSEQVSITINVEITDGLNTFEKTYGPFVTKVPKLGIRDLYKFMMFTLLDNKLSTLSGEVITEIGNKIITSSSSSSSYLYLPSDFF